MDLTMWSILFLLGVQFSFLIVGSVYHLKGNYEKTKIYIYPSILLAIPIVVLSNLV